MDNAHCFFGGPDQPRGALRDLLAHRIAAVPAGGRIDWVTYYFRDRALAQELIAASRRGVNVSCSLDAAPRHAGANDAVIALLEQEPRLSLALANRPGLWLRRLPNLRLHEKLYLFSHPRPHALLGSFNPSGDQPEADLLAQAAIGNHDVAFNLLVQLTGPQLLQALQGHAGALHARLLGQRASRLPRSYSIIDDHSRNTLHLFPRLGRHPIDQLLSRLRGGDQIRICASHIKGRAVARLLLGALGRGAEVVIAAEASQRRSPGSLLQQLASAGARVQRIVADPECWIPMHCKFVLIDSGAARTSVVGSFNWNQRSRWLNRELALVSDSPTLYAALDARWHELQRYAAALGPAVS
ncbi:MAG: phosphatidylserine/phosphatidylglycerophosphate/cardiolipin synthase family protein [Pseudomonadales bacterium]